jgi:hypothetical protein
VDGYKSSLDHDGSPPWLESRCETIQFVAFITLSPNQNLTRRLVNLKCGLIYPNDLLPILNYPLSMLSSKLKPSSSMHLRQEGFLLGNVAVKPTACKAFLTVKTLTLTPLLFVMSTRVCLQYCTSTRMIIPTHLFDSFWRRLVDFGCSTLLQRSNSFKTLFIVLVGWPNAATISTPTLVHSNNTSSLFYCQTSCLHLWSKICREMREKWVAEEVMRLQLKQDRQRTVCKFLGGYCTYFFLLLMLHWCFSAIRRRTVPLVFSLPCFLPPHYFIKNYLPRKSHAHQKYLHRQQLLPSGRLKRASFYSLPHQ